MKRFILFLLTISAAVLSAQVTPTGAKLSTADQAGLLYASNFGQWQVPAGNLGQYSWDNGSYCMPTVGSVYPGITINAFTVGTPVEIVDIDTPSHDEIVIPTAVTISWVGSDPVSCSILIAPIYGHNHFYFTSATGGLQEAINWAGTTPYQVIVTPDWSLLGGITSTITSATGNANVTILDDRTACSVAYLWSGSAYVAQGSSCAGGSSVSVNEVQVPNPDFNDSTPTADDGYTLGKWLHNGSKVSVEVPQASTGKRLLSVGVGNSPIGIAVDSANNVWVTNYADATVTEIANNGTIVGTFACNGNPTGIAIDTAGNIWIYNEYIGATVLTSAGTIKATYHSGSFGGGGQVAIDIYGNVWFDGGVKLSSSGSVLLSGLIDVSWATATASGRVCSSQSNGYLRCYNQDGSVASLNNGGNTEDGLTVDDAGNLWTMFAFSHGMSKWTSGGTLITNILFPVSGGTVHYGYPNIAVDGSENIWFAISWGDPPLANVLEYSNGGALLNTITVDGRPLAIAVDGFGSIWVVIDGTPGHVLKISNTSSGVTVPLVTRLGSAYSASSNSLTGGVLGSVPYQSAPNITAYVAPNTATTPMCLQQTGTGSASAAPVWGSCGGTGSMTWPTYTGLAKYSGSSSWSTPTYADVTSLWAGGSCTGYLRNDGTCSTPSGTSPLTTKGDLYGYSTTNARIPVGTDGDVLTADSTQALGLKWAAGGGGGGVQYNPTNTLYVFTGESTGGDDTGVLGPSFAASTWSCASGTCTVTNTGDNGLTSDSWVDVQGLTGWFVPAAPVAVLSSGYGQFKVLSTGLSATQFEFSYALNTGSGTGGTVGVATYQLPHLIQTMPFFKDHGTVKTIFDANYYCANIDADFTTLFYADSPAATGNTPEFFILDGCKNDIGIGTSVADIETHISSIMTKAHAVGYITMVQTMIPSPWDNQTLQDNWRQINVWLRGQGKSATNATSGAYWDRLADVGGKIIELRNLLYIATNGGYGPGGVALAAQIYNEAMGVQGSAVSSLPSQISVNNWGGIKITPDDSNGSFEVMNPANPVEDWFYSSGQKTFAENLDVGDGGDSTHGHVHIKQSAGNFDEGILMTDPNLGSSSISASPWGLHPYSSVGGNYEGVDFGFERLGSVANSNLNAFGIRFDSMSADAFRLSDGAGLLIPILKTTTGFGCLQIDNTGSITNTGAACQLATLKSTTDPPTATCNSTTNNGTFATSTTLGFYQCSNNNSSATYAWNVLASSSVAFTLTTTGTSGAATYSGGVLNIPQYTGGGSSSITPVNITSQLTVSGCTMNSSNTACVVGSAAFAVTFSSIPQTYTNLQIKMTIEQSGTGDTQFQLSGDTASNYAWIWQLGGSGGNNGSYGNSCYVSIENNNGWPTTCYVDYPNYSSTTWKKMWYARATNGRSGDSTDNLYFTGWWNNTGAITSYSFYPASGDTIAAGSVFQFFAD